MKAKRIICLMLSVLFLMSCIGTAVFAAGGSSPPESPLTLEELNGRRIGVLTGSVHDSYAKKYFPNSELLYFSSVSDLATAVQAGTVDAFSNDILSTYALLASNDGFSYINQPLDSIPTAFAFSKDSRGNELCGKMSDFINRLDADGTLAQLQDKWLSYGSGDYALDMSGLDKNAETLVFATSCSGKPNAYYYQGAATGYEVELALMFCLEYGYNMEIAVTDFAGIIPGLCSGKYDFGADGIAVTEERAQSVCFSVPDYYCSVVMIVKNEAPAGAQKHSYTDYDREDAVLGAVTGMATDQVYAEFMPHAQIRYFNSGADVINALKSGQIDGFLEDEPICKYLAAHTEGLAYIDEPVGEVFDAAFAVGKTDFDKKLLGELNEFILKIKSDGTMDEILELWFGTDEEKQHVTVPTEGVNGTVKVATYAQSAPVVMLKDGEICGIETDILCRFAQEYGYALELIDMDFAAIISAVNSGRCNIGSGFFYVTEERKQSVDFTEPYYGSGFVLMIAEDDTQEGSFRDRLRASFERTFIKESRWKLIVQGIETTLIISVCAAVLGTVLGFGLCLLRRMKNPVIHAFTTVYIRILQGTPLLVLLMILFYIVFAKSGLSGELVAIIAFAMNFAAYVCEMFRTGIESVDIGQTEAAYAIGFTKSQTFLRIVLPQAAVHFLPVYKGEFISLLKMTSVVGYIAVQDLTKMSDIIRSRTYEAFFPLIATAVIYFLLAALMTALLRTVELKVEPDRKNRKVKGVKMQ